ncbi:MAG: FAD-dependent oxidoreductase, partial [Nocardioidaceae bacterium]
MRIVVVGNGMAATRLVEELVARAGTPGSDHEITVVGDEPGPSYNRILLSAVLEGVHPESEIALQDESFHEDSGVTLLTGARVAEIDRQA